MKCPKCSASSGDAWIQCGESCSILFSPHYKDPSNENDQVREMPKAPPIQETVPGLSGG